jgi:NAD(P)-dependent dehydrogenase (short-subunit alcohol dehydrogenase family)
MPSAQQAFLITGCASGIGQHVAQRAVAAGRRLLATDIDGAALASVAQQHGWRLPQVETFNLDVRDADAWQGAINRAVQLFGQLDVVMNVAGVIQPGLVHEIPAQTMLLHLDVNARGVMLGTQAAARQMVRQGHGHIINISSMAGIAPIPGIASYSASKFAVRGFSLAVAQELRAHGVSVTCICPDAVETPMLDLQMTHEAAALTFSAKRFLTVDDVGRAIFERALPRRPLEITLPRSRGWLAKLTSLWPASAGWILPSLTRDSLKRQAKYRLQKEKQCP